MAVNRNKPPKRNPLANTKLSDQPPASYPETLGRAGRKRRKDATGRKKDYHQGTTTLAVRVPDEIARRVKQHVESEGLSTNAWLAALIEAALDK
jgi:siderophore synthetase component